MTVVGVSSAQVPKSIKPKPKPYARQYRGRHELDPLGIAPVLAQLIHREKWVLMGSILGMPPEADNGFLAKVLHLEASSTAMSQREREPLQIVKAHGIALGLGPVDVLSKTWWTCDARPARVMRIDVCLMRALKSKAIFFCESERSSFLKNVFFIFPVTQVKAHCISRDTCFVCCKSSSENYGWFLRARMQHSNSVLKRIAGDRSRPLHRRQ